MSRIITCCILFFCLSSLFAQKEANHWYFGNGASLDFSSGKPVAVNDGELFTNEGCASISDNNGQLLFYSDGLTVWDKKHNVMPNGQALGGSNSSTQSAIILKKPGPDAIYYIFTVDEFAGSKGLSYSIIDMKQNNGFGQVMVRNQALLTPVSEKLTAIKHSNGGSWWVIAHQWKTDAFYAFTFDEKGVSQPVISKVGSVHKDVGSGKNSESIGYLKSSPDGTRLASATSYIPNNNIELFNFNNSTGVVSDVINLPSPGNAYGVCFSPDNSKLYVSYQMGSGGIVQYDLKASPISSSSVRISPKDSTRYGALQIGPDQKIYAAKLSQYLDVIDNPNVTGAGCGFKTNGVNLKNIFSAFGLPDFFVLNYAGLKVNLGNDTILCNMNYTIDAGNPGAKYLWSTGQTQQKITVNKSGSYSVKITAKGQSTSDTIKLKFRKPLNVELGRDTFVCADIYPLDAGNSGLGYRWSSGANTQVYNAEKSGIYVVTVTDGICTSIDSVKVSFPDNEPHFFPMKEFTPSNASFNNRFDYIVNDVTWFNLKVRNKKGRVVFETEEKGKKWDGRVDGKVLPAGDYDWEFKFKTACSKNKVLSQNGIVKIN